MCVTGGMVNKPDFNSTCLRPFPIKEKHVFVFQFWYCETSVTS